MTLAVYLVVGLLYWGLNSFVRKLDIDGDWMLPLIWFLVWPIGLISWTVVFFDYLVSKKRKQHF